MPVPAQTSIHTRSLLRDDVYLSIRDAIVDGSFSPGEQLRDAELEGWLGVSRTPIREALMRLARGGLVIARPGHSTTVAPLDMRAALQAQAVASAMHELALREAVPQMVPADIERMEQANTDFEEALKRDDSEGALRADDAFHLVAVTVCGNPFVRDALEAATPLLRRVERLRFSTLAARESVAQHNDIVELCRAGDAEGAAGAVRENWRTLEHLLRSPDEP
jgi:DNA-binding GntR family transcriptional regulator